MKSIGGRVRGQENTKEGGRVGGKSLGLDKK